MEIIAHRGASFDAPENTLAAARLAWIQNADAIECDARLTRDGELVVLHDDDARRIAGVAVRATDATLAELQRLDAGRWKGARFTGERIPALAELLATVPARKRIFIEVKGGPEAVPPLARVLARGSPAPAQVAIISFNLQTAAAAKTLRREHEVCWIRERKPETATPAPQLLESLIGQCRTAQLDGLDLDARFPIDAALVSRVHEAGLKLYVWTVDSATRARRLTAAGVDGITTNRPGWLRAQLEKAAK